MRRLQPLAPARRLLVMHQRISRRILCLPLALVLSAAAIRSGDAAGQAASTRQQDDDKADVARLMEVLAVRPGAVLADIGAGDAVLTIPISREVGPSGHV